MRATDSFAHLRAFACSAVLLGIAACSGGSDPVSPPVSVSISPGAASVNAGGTQAFSATLTNASNTGVTWSATGGTIQGNGASATWTAPMSGGPYTITATSVQDPTKSANATATVKAVAVSISPNPGTVAAGGTQTFTASVANTANSAVTWSASAGTIAGTGASVVWTAPVAGGSYTVTATSVADPSKSATANVTVTPVTLSIDPATPTVGAGVVQNFTATIAGGSDNSIVWTATGGTITGSGATIAWTAPIAGGNYQVTATSAQDNTAKATAQVTVSPIAVSIAPGSTTLFRGEPRTFTATTTGTSVALSGVQWTSTCGTATPTENSLAYVAPTTGGPCTITATSTTDPSKSASVTVTLRAEQLVTATDDSNDGVCNYAHCSLREAIAAANATPAADIILLSATSVVAPPASMSLRSGARLGATPIKAGSMKRGVAASMVEGVITLASSIPDITTPITIAGPGAALLTIDAAASVQEQRRVFTVTGGDLTLSGVTIRGGRATFAGGILVQNGGKLTLQATTVVDNHALAGNGGGIRAVGGSSVHLSTSTIENNEALTVSGNGAGLAIESSTLAMNGGAIRNNASSGSFGGGAYVTSGTATFTNVTIAENSSEGGGGLAGWVAATITMTGGSIEANTATWGGGVIVGSSNTQALSATSIAFTNVVVADNIAVSQGGGFQITRNVQGSIDKTTVRDNRVNSVRPNFPSMGAGMYMGSTVNITINESTVAGNNLSGTSGFQDDGGGGIKMSDVFASAPVISNSTISGNSAVTSGGGLSISLAGLTIVNSTISGNSSATGGGVYAQRAVTLRNVSIVKNTATTSGGGVTSATGGSVSFGSVLLSGNTAAATPSNCFGSGGFSSTGFNLSDDATCTVLVAANDKNNTAAGVSPTLAANGGPTFTHALLLGSAAINAGNPATCPTTDQRGVARVGTCDIGAYEFVPAGQMMGALRPPAKAHARVMAAPRMVKAMAVDAATPITGLGAGAPTQQGSR